MNIGLWVAQALLAVAYGFFGFMKATQPLDHLAMVMKWVPTMPPAFVRTLGMLEMAGAVGIVVPALTRIRPSLTVLTAACFTTLQVLAIGLHLSRGEANVLGLNAVLISLGIFVLWGRAWKVVIQPRQ